MAATNLIRTLRIPFVYALPLFIFLALVFFLVNSRIQHSPVGSLNNTAEYPISPHHNASRSTQFPSTSRNASASSKGGGAGEIHSRGKKKKKVRRRKRSWLDKMERCDIYDGRWVKDVSSPPMYDPSSCPHIDQSFDCHRNGRPDQNYLKWRWKPKRCTIPQLKASDMLKFFRGKKIVFIGDSLNRNMWDSMVCMLMTSSKNKSRVFEASGRSEFKTETALSFVFQDYNLSVDYIRSAFLVQEGETTLRLDMVENSYEALGDADVLVFNTGNWWTHEKVSQGKDYFQEGGRVYQQLDVAEAFDKAMSTWSKWIAANVNLKKTVVFFRGYSFVHFSKGEWNTGGRCDSKDPIGDEKQLLSRNGMHILRCLGSQT